MVQINQFHVHKAWKTFAYAISDIVHVNVSLVTFVVYLIHPVVETGSSGQKLLFQIFNAIYQLSQWPAGMKNINFYVRGRSADPQCQTVIKSLITPILI